MGDGVGILPPRSSCCRLKKKPLLSNKTFSTALSEKLVLNSSWIALTFDFVSSTQPDSEPGDFSASHFLPLSFNSRT